MGSDSYGSSRRFVAATETLAKTCDLGDNGRIASPTSARSSPSGVIVFEVDDDDAAFTWLARTEHTPTMPEFANRSTPWSRPDAARRSRRQRARRLEWVRDVR